MAVLHEEHRTNSDIRMVGRAIRERWDVPEEKRPQVVTRLLDIVATTEVTVMGADGVAVAVTDKADTNAIQAARVLIGMTAQNQADDHHADKQGNDDARLQNESFAVAAAAYSRLTDGEKVAMAVRMGKVEMLPPRLREMAKKGST